LGRLDGSDLAAAESRCQTHQREPGHAVRYAGASAIANYDIAPILVEQRARVPVEWNGPLRALLFAPGNHPRKLEKVGDDRFVDYPIYERSKQKLRLYEALLAEAGRP